MWEFRSEHTPSRRLFLSRRVVETLFEPILPPCRQGDCEGFTDELQWGSETGLGTQV